MPDGFVTWWPDIFLLYLHPISRRDTHTRRRFAIGDRIQAILYYKPTTVWRRFQVYNGTPIPRRRWCLVADELQGCNVCNVMWLWGIFTIEPLVTPVNAIKSPHGKVVVIAGGMLYVRWYKGYICTRVSKVLLLTCVETSTWIEITIVVTDLYQPLHSP